MRPMPAPPPKPTPLRLLSQPLPAAMLIGLGAEALFAWRVTTPHSLVFDEIHYVPAARRLLELAGPTNIEHPLLGKTLIAAGMVLFGDGPLGWRALSTLAGTAVVLGVFAILWLLYGRVRPAVVGSLLAVLNFTVFIQARIAMLDGFMAALVVCALAAMLWAMRGRGRAVWWRWLLGAVLLGLAAGTKWVAVPYLAFAALAFVLVRRGQPTRWPGLSVPAAWVTLALGSAGAYLLSFWPAFLYRQEPLTPAQLLPFQLTMFREQTQVLPPHTYQSSWWTWALDARPIWYLYEQVDGAQRGILMIGNPAVVWGGLVAVIACLWAWARSGDRRAGTLAGVWIGSYTMWAIIPKSLGFFYYYYLSSIWLAPAIAAAFDHWRARLAYWDEAFLVVAAVLFIHFYPILGARPLAGPQSFTRWMWFASWR